MVGRAAVSTSLMLPGNFASRFLYGGFVDKGDVGMLFILSGWCRRLGSVDKGHGRVDI